MAGAGPITGKGAIAGKGPIEGAGSMAGAGATEGAGIGDDSAGAGAMSAKDCCILRPRRARSDSTSAAWDWGAGAPAEHSLSLLRCRLRQVEDDTVCGLCTGDYEMHLCSTWSNTGHTFGSTPVSTVSTGLQLYRLTIQDASCQSFSVLQQRH